MELNLKKERFSYYEAVSETPVSFETTQEAIVPDYCQDVARIVDTVGVVLVHSREMTPDGRLEINGVIKAAVLFMPDGGEEVCVIRLSIPYHSYCEGKNLSTSASCSVTARLKHIDARLLNPRKLLTRAEVVLEPTGYRRIETDLCTAPEDLSDAGLQVLEEHGETTVITDVIDREFSYAEEMVLSAGRSGIREILDATADIYPAESKIVGNKLVLKGIIRGEVLYRDLEGGLGTLAQEFLFSQIMETTASEENGMARAAFTLTGCEYTIGTESDPKDDHAVTMSLHIHSTVEVLETKQLCYLADLYSLSGEAALTTQALTMVGDVRSYSRKQNMREVLETASPVRQVCRAVVSCGSCLCQKADGMAVAQIPVAIKALYLDETGSLFMAEKTILVKGEMEAEADSIPRIVLRCPGEVSSAPSAEGLEVRFTLEFCMDTGRRIQKLCVIQATLDELEQMEERQPSVILRRMERGMRLWDIAKQYHAACADILAANQAENEQALPADKLLLIPRRKA